MPTFREPETGETFELSATTLRGLPTDKQDALIDAWMKKTRAQVHRREALGDSSPAIEAAKSALQGGIEGAAFIPEMVTRGVGTIGQVLAEVPAHLQRPDAQPLPPPDINAAHTGIGDEFGTMMVGQAEPIENRFQDPGPAITDNIDLLANGNSAREFAQETFPVGDPASTPNRIAKLLGGIAGPTGVSAAPFKIADILSGIFSGSRGLKKVADAGQAVRAKHPILADYPARQFDSFTDAARFGVGTGAATTAAVGAGGVAEQMLPDQPLARPVAETAMLIGGPLAVNSLTDAVIKRAIPPTKDTARDLKAQKKLFEQAEALGVKGAQPSLGSVPTAGGLGRALEDGAANTPFSGRKLRDVRDKQQEAAKAVFRNQAGKLRPAGTTRAGSQEQVGVELLAAAKVAKQRIEDNIGALEKKMTDAAGGAQSPVAVDELLDVVEQYKKTVPKGVGRDDNIENVTGAVRKNRVPVDAAKDARIQKDLDDALTRKAILDTKVKSGAPMTADELKEVKALPGRIKNLNRQFDENAGVEFGTFREIKTNHGQKLDKTKSLEKGDAKIVYGEMTKAAERHMRKTSGKNGVKKFRGFNAYVTRVKAKDGRRLDGGDEVELIEIIKKKDPLEVYRWIDSGGKQPIDKFVLLERVLTKKSLKKFKSDFVDIMGLATPANQNANLNQWTTRMAFSNYARFGHPVRRWLFKDHPGEYHKMQRIMQGMEGIAKRSPGTATAQTQLPQEVSRELIRTVGGSQAIPDRIFGVGTYLAALSMQAAGLLSTRALNVVMGRGRKATDRAKGTTARTALTAPNIADDGTQNQLADEELPQ